MRANLDLRSGDAAYIYKQAVSFIHCNLCVLIDSSGDSEALKGAENGLQVRANEI